MSSAPTALPAIPLERTLAFSVVAMGTLFAWIKPVSLNDLGVYLRMGAWMDAHRTLLEHEPFVLAAEGISFQNGTWLAQWLFYRLHAAGGYPALQGLLALCTFGTLLCTLTQVVKKAHWRLAGVGTLIGFAFLLQNLAIRPQAFSMLLFALVYLLLDLAPARRFTPWLLFALMAFWCNVHGAFPIAFAIPGALWLEQLVREYRQRRATEPAAAPRVSDATHAGNAQLVLRDAAQTGSARPISDDATDSGPTSELPALTHWRWLSLAGLMLVGTWINPYGPTLYLYIMENSTLPALRGLDEWLPPRADTFLGARLFLGLAVALLMAWWARRRVRVSEILLLSIFGVLSLQGVRMIVWWGLIFAPIFARWIATRSDQAPAPIASSPRSARIHTLLAYGLLVFWSAMALHAAPSRQQPQLDARGDYFNLDEETPVEALHYLELHPGGRIFNRFEWGSYALWKLWPQQRVFIDIRMWIYSDPVWQSYLEASQGLPGWQSLMEGYQIDTLLLSLQTQAGLIDATRGDPTWQEVHRDRLAVIFVRRR